MTEESSVTTPGTGLLEPGSESAGGPDAGHPNSGPGAHPRGRLPSGSFAVPLGLLLTARPRQWVKNVLVPAAAVYLVNDDVVLRHRPLQIAAAGWVPLYGCSVVGR